MVEFRLQTVELVRVPAAWGNLLPMQGVNEVHTYSGVPGAVRRRLRAPFAGTRPSTL